jgi:AraC family transcriptional regulator, activator of mtrCDE
MPLSDIDRLLVTMEVAVRNFAVCEVKRGKRLVGSPVDAIMVHYVLAGTMFMDIEGQPSVACGPGSVALVPPGLSPRMAPERGPAEEIRGLDHVAVDRDGMLVMDAADGEPGDLRFVAGIIIATHSGSFGLLDHARAPIVEDLSDSQMIQKAYQMMLEEISRPKLGSAALSSALMKAALVVVLRRYLARPEGALLLGGMGEPRLAPAFAAVLERPAAPHTLSSLAALSNLSRSSFAKLFNERVGIGPIDFVMKTRLHHAAQLLKESRLPIKAIAASVGFPSRSHFSTSFTRAYGSDPTSFRKRFQDEALDPPVGETNAPTIETSSS